MPTNPPGNPLEKSYDLPAPSERVFAAFTRPDQLERWFAEHARVDPRPGGAYRFWGRHTAWISTESDADGRVLAIESPSALSYEFTWRQTRCRVDLRIEPAGNTSRLHVRMFAPEPRLGLADDCSWFMLDLWRYSVGNLRAFLATGQPALRPDFSRRGSQDGQLDMSIFVAAPPERVFAALTDPRKMDQWLSAAARVDLRPGGEFTFGWLISDNRGGHSHCGPRRLLEVIPNRLVVHDWSHRDEPESTVRWELTPDPSRGGTIVRLSHSVPTDEPTRGGYIGGWTSFLVELTEFAPSPAAA